MHAPLVVYTTIASLLAFRSRIINKYIKYIYERWRYCEKTNFTQFNGNIYEIYRGTIKDGKSATAIERVGEVGVVVTIGRGVEGTERCVWRVSARRAEGGIGWDDLTRIVCRS